MFLLLPKQPPHGSIKLNCKYFRHTHKEGLSRGGVSVDLCVCVLVRVCSFRFKYCAYVSVCSIKEIHQYNIVVSESSKEEML